MYVTSVDDGVKCTYIVGRPDEELLPSSPGLTNIEGKFDMAEYTSNLSRRAVLGA